MLWWDKLTRKDAPQFTHRQLSDAQVPSLPKQGNVAEGGSYIRVRLRAMRIPFERKGVSRFYGVMHTSVEIPHRSGLATNLDLLVSPSELKNVDAAQSNRVIQHDRTLCEWCPYVGGDLKLRMALISVKASELAGPYVALLEEVAGLAGVAYATVAAPYVAVVRKGVDLLTGSDRDSELEIGLVTDVQPCRTGWWIVARVDPQTVDVSRWRIDSHGELIDNNNARVPNVPYFVYSIEATTTRDKWYEIPDIRASYAAVRKWLIDGNYGEAEKEQQHLLRVIRLSHDLIASDRSRLVELVKQETRLAGPATGTAGVSAGARTMRLLEELPLYS